MVESLISAGFDDVDRLNRYGQSALLMAVRSDISDQEDAAYIVTRLIEEGANPDLMQTGVTPLIRAIKRQKASVVRALLSGHADPEKKCERNEMYPIQHVCKPVNAIYSSGPKHDPSLHEGFGIADLGMLYALLSAGADPNCGRLSGFSMLRVFENWSTTMEKHGRPYPVFEFPDSLDLEATTQLCRLAIHILEQHGAESIYDWEND